LSRRLSLEVDAAPPWELESLRPSGGRLRPPLIDSSANPHRPLLVASSLQITRSFHFRRRALEVCFSAPPYLILYSTKTKPCSLQV
jgi:hypothetical protein